MFLNTLVYITSDGGSPSTSCLLPLLRVFISALLLLLLLALRGRCSYLSKLSVWSSSQFRVTLPHHARLESNLLWWKDKETLIEILPSGDFSPLVSHGSWRVIFQSPRSACCVWRCVWGRFQQWKKQRGIWVHLIPHGCVGQQQCKQDNIICKWIGITVKRNKHVWWEMHQGATRSSSTSSTQTPLCHFIDPSLYWSVEIYWK